MMHESPNELQRVFREIITQNFSAQDDFEWDERLFDEVQIPDQFSISHYLPKFICKIAN